MSIPFPQTPARDGFAMPPEWQEHAATWMIWPERLDNWRDGARPAQAEFARIAAAIGEFEPVYMLVSPTQVASARKQLPGSVTIVPLTTDDAWCRDTGPTFVTNSGGTVRGVHWHFNAWGGLYSPCTADQAVAPAICQHAGADVYRAPLILEGGSIHVDGEGTVLVTEQCLLNPNRNPTLTREQIEQHLRDYLGVSKVLWLGEGVINDETDGHIDNLACFIRPGVVALASCDDRTDPQFAVAQDAIRRLAAMTDARGRSLEVVPLPMPGPLYMTAAEAGGIQTPASAKSVRTADHRLAGSYVNFYIGNHFALVPQLDSRKDAAALSILQSLYPGRRVISVPAREVLLGGGNIHCITQQQPKAGATVKAESAT